MLVSGTGTMLQALLDASDDPAWGATVVAVGADREGTLGQKRALDRGIPTFVVPLADFAQRADWDAALAQAVAAYEPTLVVSAGFMKLVSEAFLKRFAMVNTHPALLPSFPGMHGARDALEYGVKVTGCTLFLVDAGVDTGPIIAQAAVPVLDDDDEATLAARILQEEHRLLPDVVARIASGRIIVKGRRVSSAAG